MATRADLSSRCFTVAMTKMPGKATMKIFTGAVEINIDIQVGTMSNNDFGLPT